MKNEEIEFESGADALTFYKDGVNLVVSCDTDDDDGGAYTSFRLSPAQKDQLKAWLNEQD